MNQKSSKKQIIFVDQAKFKNSRCSGCKALIARNVLRMGINCKLEVIDKWYHVGCISLIPLDIINNLDLSQIQGLQVLPKSLIEVFIKTFNETKKTQNNNKGEKNKKLQKDSDDIEEFDQQFKTYKKKEKLEEQNEAFKNKDILEQKKEEQVKYIESCISNFLRDLQKSKQ